MNHYEQRQEARRDRLEARAERLRREAQGRIDRAHDMASAIPFGQPILVGHHSESRDRNYRGRIHSNFDKGFQGLKAAGEVAARAASVGTGGISSDDPDAIAKLADELAKAEALQARMTLANKIVRKFAKDVEGGVAALAIHGFGEAVARALFKADCCGRVGFADFQLANNGANVRRIKARMATLAANAQREHVETRHNSGVTVVENVELNRLQLIFPDKPDATIRAALKSGGFRWSPTEGAWQRHLSNGARYAAQCILEKLQA